MSKYLIIFAHPSHEGHGGYLLSEIEKRLKNEKKDFQQKSKKDSRFNSNDSDVFFDWDCRRKRNDISRIN